MLKCLSRENVPKWLDQFSGEESINFEDVFSNSIYYPACGFDADVLNLCMGYSHSFVYVDNLSLTTSMDKKVIYDFINLSNIFGAYKPIFQAEYSKNDLIGQSIFTKEFLKYGDGNPDLGLPSKDFFAILTIFIPKGGNRIFTHSDRSIYLHIYEPFAFLYVCDDGCFSYQKFYYSHNRTAKGVAIIQPGDAFGGNWTSYYDRSKVFGRIVMNNPAGVPEILVSGGKDSRGGYFRKQIWGEYNKRMYYSRLERKGIAIWMKGSSLENFHA